MQLKLIFRIINKTISYLNTKIIAVSKTVKNFLIKYEYLNPKKLLLIYNGIDTKRFRKSNRLCKRKKFELKKDDFVIGIVGRLNYQKAHDVLLEAIAKIKDKIPNMKVLIVGEGERQKKLKILCKKLNIEKQVIFKEFQQKIEQIYNCFDILCLPSRSEGLPLVLIEAMACERMCICSDIKNNQEVINNDIDGVLVKVGDISALASEIYIAYKNPKKRIEMGKRARIKVKKKFELLTSLKTMETLYFEVLK